MCERHDRQNLYVGKPDFLFPYSQHPKLNETTHLAHNSDRPTLLAGNALKLCGTCHATRASVSHPMGAGIIDPRNNQPVNCRSCYDPHGMPYDKFLRGSQRRELCIECHKQYR
jgi:predicted CXXCH cytochrome family protein